MRIPVGLLVGLLSLPFLVTAQKGAKEDDYIRKLDARKDSLNAIEGIWSVSNTQQFYRYDTLYDEVRYSKAARVAVLWVDGKYKSFDMEGNPYEVEFSTTDVKGVYLYRNYFKETDEYSKAQAVISRAGEMEYAYDFPDNYLRLRFSDSYEEGTRVSNVLTWTRVYPPAGKKQ